MSGTRTAGAVLAASVIAGGVLVAGQQPARAGQTPSTTQQPARGQTAAPTSTTQQPAGGGQGQNPSPLPLTPTIRERGSGLTPALEGWYHGKDGNDYILVGYFNRNTKQEFDIPVGPDNHMDPGGPDMGQPTHFLLGRQWGVFTVKVPKDFGNKKFTWTIVANGLSNSITLQTYPVYITEPYKASWNDNTPPVLKLAPDGPSFTGPPQGIAESLTTTMPAPVTLDAWITDDNVGARGAGGAADPTAAAPAAGGAAPAAAGRGGRGGRGAAAGAAAAPPAGTDAAAQPPQDGAAAPAAAPTAGAAAAGRGGRGGRGAAAPAGAAGAAAGGGGRGGISVTWTKFRGPGAVTFANAKPPVDAANGGKTETTATFDAPGDYILRGQGNDASGDGGNGEQCCWTNVHVKVTVKPAVK